MQRTRIEPLAYIMLISGALGDWISTRLGLTIGLIEGNEMARNLMSSGLWVQTDLVMVLVCIALPSLFIRLSESKVSEYMLSFPFLAGLAKLVVTAWNISLIL